MSDVWVSFPKPCSERWDDMSPRGCNRHCERCDKIIHDLAQLTFEEADRLARSEREICVRAQIGSDGVVRLKQGSRPSARRMVTTIGASVGIVAASGQAAVSEGPKLGAIKGAIARECGNAVSVSATAADGRVYHAKIGTTGRFKVKRLPAGSYEVKLEYAQPGPPAEANAEASSGQVLVESGRTSVLNLTDPDNSCVIVGVMTRIDDK